MGTKLSSSTFQRNHIGTLLLPLLGEGKYGILLELSKFRATSSGVTKSPPFVWILTLRWFLAVQFKNSKMMNYENWSAGTYWSSFWLIAVPVLLQILRAGRIRLSSRMWSYGKVGTRILHHHPKGRGHHEVYFSYVQVWNQAAKKVSRLVKV